MKSTRQLRLDALAADGTAPIHLPITWEGNRLRLGTGAVVRPEHWDAEARQVKAQKGTPHASINPRLNRAHEAAEEARALATKQGRKLPAAELRAALDAALVLTPVGVQQAAAPVAAPASDFASLYAEWLKEHTHKPRSRDGRPLSGKAIAGFNATLERFLKYEQARQVALRVEALDLAFYQDFRTYLVEELGQGINTFVTLKLYQGVPARTIMQATGHQTEEVFNAYVGVDELKLVESFMRKSQRRRAA